MTVRTGVAMIGALAGLLMSASVIQAQAAVLRAALNGEWSGTLVLDNSAPRLTLHFELSDSAFFGTVYADGQVWGKMEHGTLAHDTVHFNVDRFDFTGVVRGARMDLALIVYNGTTRHLVLTRTPDVPPVRGASPPRSAWWPATGGDKRDVAMREE